MTTRKKEEDRIVLLARVSSGVGVVVRAGVVPVLGTPGAGNRLSPGWRSVDSPPGSGGCGSRPGGGCSAGPRSSSSRCSQGVAPGGGGPRGSAGSWGRRGGVRRKGCCWGRGLANLLGPVHRQGSRDWDVGDRGDTEGRHIDEGPRGARAGHRLDPWSSGCSPGCHAQCTARPHVFGLCGRDELFAPDWYLTVLGGGLVHPVRSWWAGSGMIESWIGDGVQ